MAKVKRYSPSLIEAYEAAGHWTPDYPVDFWEKEARRNPRKEALVFEDSRYTWSQAWEAIQRLAVGLSNCGLAKDDLLALQAPNSAQLLLLRLAAERAGVVTVLVPPAFSRVEIEAICRGLPLAGALLSGRTGGHELAATYRAHSRTPFVLLSVGDAPIAGARAVGEWLTDTPHAEIGVSADTGIASRRFAPYEYAAIITTSGTTGLPRFIEHTACARAAAGRVYVDRLKLGPDDVIASATSIFAGNCDLVLYHAAPQAGARTVLIEHFDPASFCRTVEREGVTCAIFVPTLLHRLLAYPGLRSHDLSSLRIITSFGAVLPPETAQVAEQVLGVQIIQGYGASDYGALASTSIEDPRDVRLTSVGRPLPGTEILIADESGAALPQGAVGRVYARGPYCVGGYIGDDVATSQAWSNGFFAMGDVGRVDESGYLWLAGRARELIIRGSQNIVPAEVESMILAHPDVAEASVLGLPDVEMGERVCAVVVPRGGAQVTIESLTAYLREAGLARFKFPERLLSVASMPLNPAATKIDKKTLRDRLLEAESQGKVTRAGCLGGK